MSDDWIWILGLTLAVSMAVFLVIRVRIRQAHEREEAERQAEQLRKAIENGAVPPGKCFVCKERDACEFFPYIGRSSFEDFIPLRALYHVPPMYARKEDTYSGPMLCRSHRLVLDARIDDALAEVRQRTAAFSTEIALKIATLDGGMLLEWARQQERTSVEALSLYARQAQPASTPPVLAVPATRILTMGDDE